MIVSNPLIPCKETEGWTIHHWLPRLASDAAVLSSRAWTITVELFFCNESFLTLPTIAPRNMMGESMVIPFASVNETVISGPLFISQRIKRTSERTIATVGTTHAIESLLLCISFSFAVGVLLMSF